jgi:hypothetical protein
VKYTARGSVVAHWQMDFEAGSVDEAVNVIYERCLDHLTAENEIELYYDIYEGLDD